MLTTIKDRITLKKGDEIGEKKEKGLKITSDG
jgi:hypothetical protein